MDRSIPPGAAIVLDFIRKIETGSDGQKGYDTIFGHNQDKLAKPLTQMTLAQVQSQQRGWSKKFGSSAAGGYQFMRATLAGLIKELRLAPSMLLDADLQDRLGYHLMKRRGWLEFVAGEISATEFGKRLAMEWASFPVLADCQGAHRKLKRGQSYYAGDGLNKALVKPEAIEAVMARAKAAAAPPPVVVEKEIEKPIVQDPEELDKPLTRSKTVWQWLLTMIAAPFAVFGDLDWRVQLAIVVVIVSFGAYAIKRRRDLAIIMRDLKREFGG